MPEILVLIPVYNHPDTLRRVAEGVLAARHHLLVLDDGSQEPVAPLLAGLPLELLRHHENHGKGAAILSAATWAREKGFSHLITLDADGQHDPAELPKFIQAINEAPRAFIVGARNFGNNPNVPFSSRFGRRFSKFWIYLQTGRMVDDMQSGYRSYPLAALEKLRLWDQRYSFEIEVLVNAAWAGFEILEIPVSVHYPPAAERVSHFQAFTDNLRITMLNTRLTIRALIPVPFRQLAWEPGERISVRRPLKALKRVLADQATAWSLALSTFVPIVACCLPILGFQSILVLFLIAYFRLNRLWALAVSHACLPPLMPAFCIEFGHYLRNGVWLTDISWQTMGREVFQRLGDWVLGALVGGPLLGAFLGSVAYLMAAIMARGLKKNRLESRA